MEKKKVVSKKRVSQPKQWPIATKFRPTKSPRRTAIRATADFSYDASAVRNGNWRSRCGCNQFDSCNTLQWGQSYITINNQSGRYKLKFYLRSYGKQHWWNPSRTFDENWNAFVNTPHTAYIRFDSGIIQPRASGGGYFRNGNNDTGFGGQAGTIGVEIFDSTGTRVRRILFWPKSWTNWGTLWMRCGHDYNFNFFEI
ncbi:hypothetical protein [Paenibacillus crassostreae]|uniref:Uncharacterized protein n=1 Tax=Paenibacillus crassostreae TaxID=1763538 RepID=A0A167EJ01_9BACL|nr:hypothetical protein [Paenibacillus crassostreae]AOZ94907.1 hypothetical protein LPB68_21850 [Paenibacillus crassostreae]OAB75589.1 hypothetical protein PNBC_08140 [Paenibacillus crassostreae]